VVRKKGGVLPLKGRPARPSLEVGEEEPPLCGQVKMDAKRKIEGGVHGQGAARLLVVKTQSAGKKGSTR